MYVVRLGRAQDLEQAIATLKKKAGVRFVLPFSAKSVDAQSYRSVDLHVQYLKDADSLKNEDGAAPSKSAKAHVVDDAGDFYDALRYYLRRRVAVGSDHVDAVAQREALRHAAAMPSKRLDASALPGPVSPDIVSGGWSFIGPSNLPVPYQIFYGTPPLSGRISCIAYDPTTSETIYAGSGGGGLWKTTDGGNTWICISDKAPFIYPAVDCIAVDPSSHNILYVGTGDFDGFFAGYNQGIMKSTDGGATWTNLAANVPGIYNLCVSRIVIDPDNDQIVTCTTGRGSYGGPNAGTGNVFRSTDGGATWSSAGLTPTDYCALDISIPDGTNTRTYWAAGASTVGPGILYKSTNQGASWTPVAAPDANGEVAWSLACSKVSASTLYVVATGSNHVYKSTTAGANWVDVTSTMPGPANNEDNWSQSSYDYFIGTVKAPQAAAGEIVFCGLITLAYSLDGGVNWIDYGLTYQNNAVMHNDQHQFALPAADSSQVLVGNDGGVFSLALSWMGANLRISMTSLNADLGITQFYFIAPHPTDPAQVLGGAQDNACPSEVGDSNEWLNLGGGDGGYCGWDLAENLLYVTADEGTVYTYNLSGGNESVLSNGFNNDVGFEAPTVTSADGATMFLGTTSVLRANLAAASPAFDNGTTVLASGAQGDYVNVIGIAPSDNERLYAATASGLLWISANLGASWVQVNPGALPQQAVPSAMSTAPASENDVLVGFQNTGIQHLWRTTNINSTAPTWVSVSGTGTGALPDVPLNAIVRDPYNPTTTWYVGTDVGVFMTENSGATWSNVDSNLPEVQIFDLKYGSGYLYAGTYGRGIWRVLLPTPLASLSLASNSVTSGTAVACSVALAAAAPASNVTVAVSSSSGAATAPTAVTVLSGAQSKSFVLTTNQVTAPINVTISASSGGVTKSQTLTVKPGDPVGGISLASSFVEGGKPVNCTVVLSSAFSSTVFVSMSSSSSNATLPSTVAYAAGATTDTFSVNTKAVTSAVTVTLSASSGGVTKTASLTINPADPLSVFALAHQSITAGTPVNSAASLTHPAPVGGIPVTFASSDPDVVPAPNPTTYSQGVTTQIITLTTYSVVAAKAVTLSATAQGVTKSTTLTVNPAAVSLSVPSQIPGGTNSTGVVRFSAKATKTTTVSISSNNALVTVPTSAPLGAGLNELTFQFQTKGVDADTAVVLTISYGAVTQSAPLTLYPAPLASLTISPVSVVGGKNSDAVVRLNGQAGPSGAVVTISSSSPDAVVQSGVRVASGASLTSFPIQTKAVSATRTVIITVTYRGTSMTQRLNLTP